MCASAEIKCSVRIVAHIRIWIEQFNFYPATWVDGQIQKNVSIHIISTKTFEKRWYREKIRTFCVFEVRLNTLPQFKSVRSSIANYLKLDYSKTSQIKEDIRDLLGSIQRDGKLSRVDARASCSFLMCIFLESNAVNIKQFIPYIV